MEEEKETAGNSFIYTNWRGKCYIIDERFAEDFRKYLIEEGERPEDVAYLTPTRIMKSYLIWRARSDGTSWKKCGRCRKRKPTAERSHKE